MYSHHLCACISKVQGPKNMLRTINNYRNLPPTKNLNIMGLQRSSLLLSCHWNVTGLPSENPVLWPTIGPQKSGKASLLHFCVPYTVSTMRISGHWIFKRLPQGNKAGEHGSLCQMEGGWCLTSAFYRKKCSFTII